MNDAELIYELYPKKVAKPKALEAITKALKKHTPEYLRERTAMYAKARKGEESQFTPYPATFFNQERFNDDPATWTNGSAKAHKEPAPVGDAYRPLPPPAEISDEERERHKELLKTEMDKLREKFNR